MELRYFEDVEIGETHTAGGYEMTYDEIVEFAERYDPQPFHTDEPAEIMAVFGDLVASGWHTAAVCMRLLVECFNSDVAVLGSPGVDELRWPNPVHPEDTISLEVEIADKRRSESNPEFGIVTTRWRATNQDGDPVLTAIDPIFVKCRGEPE